MKCIAPELPLLEVGWPVVHWFAAGACVVEESSGQRQVLIGGSLVGRFTAKQRSMRNALLLGLSEDEDVNYRRLAAAFGVSVEMVRQLRHVAREQGVEAALLRAPGGGKARYSQAQRRRLHKLFEAGVGPKEARAALGGQWSQRTVERVRTAWLAAQAAAPAPAPPPSKHKPHEPGPQLELPGSTTERAEPAAPLPVDHSAGVIEPADEGQAAPAEVTTPVMREYADDELRNAPTEVRSAPHVQHLGALLLVAMVSRLGLFARAAEVGTERITDGALRIALEALVVALGIGELCVEGVRRIATPSAGALLRAQWAPSATWTRRILGSFSQDLGGHRLHMEMAGEYLRHSRRPPDAPAVFYIDNHLRPYSGDHPIRRGWRMQAKRALPGTTDYYVHDEDGRPVFRFAVPENAGLTEWLPGIAHTLREVLEAGESMVLAFDRAGAFADHMALLRNDEFSFVTYERRPYPQLFTPAFTNELRFDQDDETVRYVESRTNLGEGRGRVRRIAMQVGDPRDGTRQVNLVAAGPVPAPTLITIMRNRWRQENGFKHGVARWGINQLDGRTTDPYPEDAVIPNPARRRLDRALRLVRTREGTARSALAKLPAQHPRRPRLQQDLDDALFLRRELQAQRAVTPDHAAVADTELSGLLRRHRDEYKVTIDAVRIACANAESELAVRLGPLMNRPAEAKKLLANLFRSPGRIVAAANRIHIHLQPAGSAAERLALTAMLTGINRCKLTLPGDSTRRPLHFDVQI